MAMSKLRMDSLEVRSYSTVLTTKTIILGIISELGPALYIQNSRLLCRHIEMASDRCHHYRASLTFTMLAYDLLKYPPKYASAGTAGAHFGEYFNNQ